MSHDPLCEVSEGSCCPWMGLCECQCTCEFIREIRADELRQAQEAVAKMPLHSFPDGGRQAALIFQDGWATGFAAALRQMVEDPDSLALPVLSGLELND